MPRGLEPICNCTSEVGACVGKSIRLREITEGEFGALGDTILETGPEWMRREKRGEELGQTIFGTGRHGTAERLGTNGRPKVKCIATEDGEIVESGLVRPLETELPSGGLLVGGR